MKSRKLTRSFVCIATMSGLLLVPTSGASASDASIKHLIDVFSPQIVAAEGRVLSAVSAYETTRKPAPVVKSVRETVDVLRTLRGKVARQRALSRIVREDKAKLDKGLEQVIHAYEDMRREFRARATTSTHAAQVQAEKADAAVTTARQELAEELMPLKE